MRMRMHGWRAGEEEGDRKREGRRRHMWTVPPRDPAILASVADGGSASPSSSSSLSSSPNSVTFFSQVIVRILIFFGLFDFFVLMDQ